MQRRDFIAGGGKFVEPPHPRLPRRRWRAAAAVILVPLALHFLHAQDRDLSANGALADPTPVELAAFLRRVPVPSPGELLASLQPLPGFHAELVAAEPLVCSPVAAAFDEDGNLYVAEMIDYPYNRNHPVKVSRQNDQNPDQRILGRLRLLRDRDNDGYFEESHVFAEELLWAAGIAPWRGGVFVASPPDILYLKDTDGDGRADIRRVVFTGFDTRNQQASVNTLVLGLDHLIYGSSGANGGSIRPGADPQATPVRLTARDFRFDPVTERFEAITGTMQFGLTFDDWGNRFLCNQNHPCSHVVLPQHYLERNPHFAADLTIHHTTPLPTPLHRTSPIERWRHIKSSRRLASPGTNPDAAGVSHHVVDAAAGITVYRGGAYPPEFYGNVFIGDSVSNVVHRRALVPDGATFRSERVDAGTEFLRSANPWFRPVNFVNAPDGTLYCLDMAREHSESVNIPPDVQAHLDLTSGRYLGRIYRIAPRGYRRPPQPRLGAATTADLVAALESPHGWWRDTAHRLLFERQDKTAAAALVKLTQESPSAASRVQALWSLRGLGALDETTLLTALADSHGGVRRNAIQLAEPSLESSADLREAVARGVDDPDAAVRLQVAFAVGETRRWNQASLLASLVLAHPGDRWLEAAGISSAAQCSDPLFERVHARAGEEENLPLDGFLRRLAVTVGARNQAGPTTRVAERLLAASSVGRSLRIFSGLVEGILRNKSGTAIASAPPFAALLERSRVFAADATRGEADREAALLCLGLANDAATREVGLRLLAADQPPRLQTAAIHVLARHEDAATAATVIERWPVLTTPAKQAAFGLITERPLFRDALFAAVSRQQVRAEEFSPSQVNQLRRHREPKVRTQALRLFGAAADVSRSEVYAQYRPALELRGDAARGRPIFASRCAACHELAGTGIEVGPNLAAMRSADPGPLLASIVDPNRAVAPQYVAYVAELRDGTSVAGILASDTPAQVTLVMPGGLKRRVARDAIATLEPLPRSFMPEGLENGLSLQDMADLLEYLRQPTP